MIEIQEQVVDYFGKYNVPAFWLVQKLMEEDSELGRNIRHLLNELDIILRSSQNDQPSWINKLGHLPSGSKRIMGLSHLITTVVAAKRLAILSTDYKSREVRPYDHPDLKGIKPDPNGLVKHREFDTLSGGLRRGSSVFEILPSIANAANSMYWANRSLAALGDKAEVLIRIDPLMVQPIRDYRLTCS